jgi:hypothetical protein
VPIPVDGFLGFPYLSVFAKLSIVLVCLANEILENLDFPMYFCELVCVLLIVHDASPPTRILRLFPGPLRANPSDRLDEKLEEAYGIELIGPNRGRRSKTQDGRPLRRYKEDGRWSGSSPGCTTSAGS